MKKKKNAKHPIIHARYIFPLVSDMILVLLLFIPTFRFYINSKLQYKQSVFALIKNSWTGARQYLFSATAETTPVGTSMYKTIFFLLILFVLLFVLGILIDVFTASVFYKELSDKAENKKRKDIYLAIIPNRALLCLFRLAPIPIFFFADTVASLYRDMLAQAVTVRYILIHPAITVALLYAVSLLFTILSKKSEALERMDIFAKHTTSSKPDTHLEKEEEAEEYVYRIDENENTTERIRKMFDDKN